jgi:hypothetical protein
MDDSSCCLDGYTGCPSEKRCFKLGAMTFLLGTVAIESRLVGGSLDYPHVVEGYGAPLLSESF